MVVCDNGGVTAQIVECITGALRSYLSESLSVFVSVLCADEQQEEERAREKQCSDREATGRETATTGQQPIGYQLAQEGKGHLVLPK